MNGIGSGLCGCDSIGFNNDGRSDGRIMIGCLGLVGDARFDLQGVMIRFAGMSWIEWDQESGLVAANQLNSTMTGDGMGGDDEGPSGFGGGCSIRFVSWRHECWAGWDGMRRGDLVVRMMGEDENELEWDTLNSSQGWDGMRRGFDGRMMGEAENDLELLCVERMAARDGMGWDALECMGWAIELVGLCIQSRVPQFHRGIWFVATCDRMGWAWMRHLVYCCKQWDGIAGLG